MNEAANVEFEKKKFIEQFCKGRSVQEMLKEASVLLDEIHKSSPRGDKTAAKQDSEDIKKKLDHVHSIFTACLYVLFESTLPEGFFTHNAFERAKPRTVTPDARQDDGRLAIKLRFASEGKEKASGDIHKNVGRPEFTRKEYETLSIRILTHRGWVNLRRGHPLQGFIDSENALFFCHRLKYELGEIEEHLDCESIFDIMDMSKITEEKKAIFGDFTWRIGYQDSLNVLGNMAQAQYMMRSFLSAMRYAALHEWLRGLGLLHGCQVDRLPNFDEIKKKAEMMGQSLKDSKPPIRLPPALLKREKADQQKVIDQQEELLFSEVLVPYEELSAMANEDLHRMRFHLSETPFSEDQMEEALRNITKRGEANKCRIENVPGMGYGIIATDNIRKGEMVLSQDFLVTSNTYPQTLCGHCSVLLPPIKSLWETPASGTDIRGASVYSSPCKHEFYCSESCLQTAIQSYHKPLCRMWTGIKALYAECNRGLTDVDRSPTLIVRMWAMKRAAPLQYRMKNLLGRDAFRTFIKFRQASYWHDKSIVPMQCYVKQYKMILKTLPTLARDPLFDIHFMLSHEALISQYSFGCSRSQAIYLAGSFFNHSCVPNIDNMDKGFVANTNIRCGEQLFVSYRDVDRDLYDKSMSLLQYGFRCQCERCVRERQTDKRDEELVEFLE